MSACVSELGQTSGNGNVCMRNTANDRARQAWGVEGVREREREREKERERHREGKREREKQLTTEEYNLSVSLFMSSLVPHSFSL